MKTREEVEKLKHNWLRDPCWDIYDTEGFEEYKEELTAYQKAINDKYLQRLKEENDIEKSEAEKLGLHGLYKIIKDLYIENEYQHKAIMHLTKGETRTAYLILDRNPEYVDNVYPPKININQYFDSQINNPEQTEPIINRQLEIATKTAYVQGVCECVAAVGDNYIMGKKLLSEMNVTKEMAKKYANPETYKTLEKGIFAQTQDQKLNQTQGVKR